MEDKKLKAIKLLEKFDSVQLASITLEGYPRVCEMELTKVVGISEIYFSTIVSSAKVEHYKNNNKAGVSYSDDENSVSLVGEVEIIHDIGVKKELWLRENDRRFAVEENGRPKYCVLKFKTTGATFYIDNKKMALVYEDFFKE